MNATQPTDDDRISLYLGEFDALPIHWFIGEDDRCDDDYIENIGQFFAAIDVLYYRDTMTRRHARLYGPHLTASQLRATDLLGVRVLIIEIDADTDMELATELVEMTRPWRCYE